jgi:hypothetical protein
VSGTFLRILEFLMCAQDKTMSTSIQECAPTSPPGGLPQVVFEKLLRQAIADWVGNGDLSAYADFAASSFLSQESTALRLLQGRSPSGVPIHTIAGIAYEGGDCAEKYLRLVRLGWNLPYGQSDLIVSSQSASGGLAGDFTQGLGGVCHTQETGGRLVVSRPGQPAPLPDLLDDIMGRQRFYEPGLPRP